MNRKIWILLKKYFHCIVRLRLSLSDITGESYIYTHYIGKYAYENGYNGIIAPSARADGGLNIILFNTKKVN